MTEALRFLGAAISAADVGGVWLLLAVVAVALFFHVPRLRHPRYRWRVLVVLATAGLVLTLVTRRESAGLLNGGSSLPFCRLGAGE